MAGGPRIVVGIDFGTTYSGVAWALQSSPEEVEVIKSWPGARNRTTPKVPTTISYENGKFFWGYQTPMFGEIIRGVKLLLDSTQEIDYTPAVQSKDLLTKYDKKPLDIARDCLQLLVDSAKETLRRRFGKALDGMEITYVLTVPAVWTDKAKNMTLTAATDAGISALDVILVSEPEAAALSCLNASQLDTLKDGDVVIICDAGGGTVDLISYCVKSVEPLELMEVTQGTVAYSVPLNGVSDKREIGLEGGFLTMSKENVGGIFLPVVDDIENLVQEQMLQVSMAGMQTKAILLVGGFGSSEYLFRRLQSAVINVTVMQPPNAWSAVVRGAVFRGLGGNQVGQRIARCHYGVTFEEEYNPRVHNARDKYWDAMTEMSYVADRMKWYIEKGKPISEDEPIRMSWHHDISEASCMKQLKKVSQSLYICNLDKAPDHLTEGVFKVCTLEADLSAIPPYLFHSCTNSSGQKYYEVAFEIAMTPTSASILFDLEFNGVSYGSVQAKY